MFTADFYIDAFQNYKRTATNAVITDKVLNKAANDYIDSQTAFAKTLAHNSLDLAKYWFETSVNNIMPKASK